MFKFLTHLILLIVTPISFIESDEAPRTSVLSWKELSSQITYDDVLLLLERLESGELEKTYSPKDLERVNGTLAFLATLGASEEEQVELEEDIENLLGQEETLYEEIFYQDIYEEYQILPTLFAERDPLPFTLCKSWVTKKWKNTKKFVRKHKKAIIIGTVVVVAVAAVIYYAPTAAAGGLAAVGGALGGDDEEESFEEDLKENISNLKEKIEEEGLLQEDIPIEENGRIIGSLFAHETLNELATPSDEAHQFLDERFATDYSQFYGLEAIDNPTAFFFQIRGEYALENGYLDHAVEDFTKVLEADDTNPDTHLGLSVARLKQGNYEESLDDFEKYKEHKKTSFVQKYLEFKDGIDRAFLRGAGESIKETGVLACDIVTHPIRTTESMYDAMSAIAKMGLRGEWAQVVETFIPEVVDVVRNWSELNFREKAEASAHIFGKYGTDIAISRGASAGLKGAKNACRMVKTAKKVSQVELAAAKTAQKAARVAGKVEKATEELSHLKKANKVVIETLEKSSKSIGAKSTSEAYSIAKNGGKHSSLINNYSNRTVKEIQKSIKSYEKQIIIHQDKITNPKKYCPEWDSFHPNRKKALLEKVWPNEINCFSEEKDILQELLKER
ncbi:MAG: tetratricopeptide repeat protein [Candidatus Algichlamydia australiensis]|nr:tetratricopeptide repeat protein [Chlamydiales bacterium]